MSVEIAPSTLPPLAKLQDKREVTYTQDSKLARLMADKETPHRKEATRKKYMSGRLKNEKFMDKANEKMTQANELITTAKEEADALEKKFEGDLTGLIEEWADNVEDVSSGRKRSPLELKPLNQSSTPVYNNLVNERARERFLTMFRVGEPVTPPTNATVWESTLPGNNASKMSLLRIHPMSTQLGEIELIEGIPGTLPGYDKVIQPYETVWAVRRATPPSGGVGGN